MKTQVSTLGAAVLLAAPSLAQIQLTIDSVNQPGVVIENATGVRSVQNFPSAAIS